MTTPQYAVGAWKGVIAAGCIALLPPETDDSIIQRLWRSMIEGEDLMSQLVIITDGRFAGLPAFAIAQIEGAQIHLMLRGDIELTVGRASGEQCFTAPSVSTWLEQIVDDATSISLHPPQVEGHQPNAGRLPIAAGVVLASEIFMNLRTADGDIQKVGRGRRAAVPDLAAATDAVLTQTEPAAPVFADEEPDSEPESDSQSDSSYSAVPPPPSVPESPAVSAPPAVPEPSAVSAPPAGAGQWLDSEQAVALEPPLEYSQEDHDGMTVMNSEVVALRQQLPAWEGDAAPSPMVDPADRTVVPKIVLSTGMAVALDRPILLGRAPQVSRVKNDEMPRLITVESPNHDISRTHAEVRMDGPEIVVTDLTSTNGVLLTRPGAVAERLQPGVPTAVEAGAVVDLGEGVTFVVGRQA
ncbi:MAG TPA: FHA domain-containing protein [Actinomycetales bacterium]|nr:FHA domain-containing protein [Actinomycetales bacterium]